MTAREVQLTALPDGEVAAENFGVFDADLGSPGAGEVLALVRRLGLNAGLAHRIGGEGTAYGPGIGVGDVPVSDAVLEVLESNDEAFQHGDLVVGKSAWRTESVLNASELRAIPTPKSDDELTAYLTILGHVGFTAYTGMTHIGQVRADDVVAVSGAAGGVGSCAVQFAKARGAKVIGIAGSDEKISLLTDELGADHAINRHHGAVLDQLQEVLNPNGRVVICGAVAQASGPANYRNLIYKELTMRGFTVTEHEDLRETFEAEVGEWLREGMVQSVHTIFEGIDRLPEAFASMLSGGTTGRAVVTMD